MWVALISAVGQLGANWMASGAGREPDQGSDMRQIYYDDLRMRNARNTLALQASAQSPDWLPLALFSVVLIGALVVVGRS